LYACLQARIIFRRLTQRQLLPRLEHLLLHLLDFTGKHNLGRCCGVNASSLDRDEDVSVVLKEVVSVEGDDTGLVGLSDIGKAVYRTVSGQLNNISRILTNMTSTMDISMRYLLG
jgi:hypothetical protein